MAPKRVKSGTASAGAAAAAGNKAWESGLTSAHFEEESWRASVSLVVPERLEDEGLIGALQRAVQLPLRRLFSLVSWDNTLQKINELGNPKTKKTKDAPAFYEVLEAAKALLDAGEELSGDLLGKLLKFQLLGVKASDQQRRTAELKAVEEKAKGKVASATKDKGGGKGDKGKKGSEPSAPAKDTKLKRRGEEDETRRYIDDEPDDGPQHYVLVVGFDHAQLPAVLESVGVHVSNVIQLASGATPPSVGEGAGEDGKALDQQAEAVLRRRRRELEWFWAGLGAVLDDGPALSKLHDVVRLRCTAKQTLRPQDRDSTEAVMAFGTHVFEEVACLIYDSLDWRRQHHHYLSSMRLIQVPSAGRPPPRCCQDSPAEAAQTPTPQTPGSKKKSVPEETTTAELEAPLLTSEVDMRYYSDLLELLPPEASSVPLMLHCMLEQVVVSETLCLSRTEQRHGLDPDLANYMLSTILTLPLPEQDKTRLQEELGVEQSSQQRTGAPQRPLLFNSHDHRALRLQQLPAVCKGLDAVQAEADMMKRSPVWSLLTSSSSSSCSSSTRHARTQQLVHYCTDASLGWGEVECVFRQCVLESMALTKVDDQGVLPASAAREPVLIPWDDPVAFAKHLRRLHTNTQGGVCASEQLSVADIRSSKLRDLTDWHCAEHHPANVLPQVLQSASETYRCMDTFRGSLDNTLYIICHNPMGPQRQCKEFWDMALHTDVGFRRYLEHVADSISDWTKEEEAKWLAEQARREAERLRGSAPSESCESGKPESGKRKGAVSPRRTATSPATSPVPEEAASEAYIREDSLKAWKLEQDRLREEEQGKKAKKEKGGGRGSAAKGGERADSSRENRKDVSRTPDLVTAPPGDETGELQPHGEAVTGFIGYSMEGSLIQVFGQVQSLFPSDGGRIQVETIHFVQGSSLIKVCVTKDQHHFYTHIYQPIREPEEPDTMEKGGTKPTNQSVRSFSAVLANGIHLSYSHYGPTGEHTGHLDAGQSSEVDFLSASSPSPSPVPSPQPPPSSKKAPPLQPSRGGQPSPPSCSAEEQSVPRQGGPVPPAGTPPFQTLSLSTPTGLLVQFLRDHTDALMVRQSFPVRLSDPALPRETSRVITAQGAVLKYMRDGSTQVLFADGSVSSSPDSGPVVPLASSPPPREEEPAQDPAPEPKDTKDKKGKLKQAELEPSREERLCSSAHQRQEGFWVTTAPSGSRVSTRGNTHTHTSAAPALAFRSTDPITHTVVVTREDQVLTVLEPDGTVIVEHADGTRITTLYQQRAQTPAQTHTHTHTHTTHGAGGEEERPPRSACDERPESACGEREKVVMVERQGYATVVMYPEEHSCHLFLGDGTVVTATHTGVYQVFPSSEGLLVVKQDGTAVYAPDSAHTPTLTCDPGPDPGLTSEGRNFGAQPGSYLMSHTDDIACEVLDPHGNLFQVRVDGQTSVMIPSTAPEEEEEDREEEERELARTTMGLKEQCPRLFLVHEDGSGTELLSSQAVEELLYQAYSDSTIALMKEPIPDLDGAESITVLKPCHQSVWSSWLMHKQNQDIVPVNLKSRTWDRFPSTERRTPGPAFGTSLGRGLCLGDPVGSPARGPVLSCPEALEIRQLVRHRPVTPQLRSVLESRLKDYMQQVVEREQQSEEMLLKDPRTEEERTHANDLLKLVLSLPDSEGPSYGSENRTKTDVATLYCQVVAPGLQNDASVSNTSHRDTDSEGQQESLWAGRIQQHRQELCEERLYREALRNRIITPYFHSDPSEEGPDMRSLSRDLPPFPQTGQSESFLREAPQETAQRPLNPTPSHAAGSDAAPVGRPANPTPASVGRPANPTPQTAGDVACSEQSSVQVDVSGRPRRSPVQLPSSILSSKPYCLPNQQFLSVEEPVRRKGRTVSVIGQQPPARGFELLPSEVTFGTLREGSTYAVTMAMRNVGVDTCRFSVKQPSPCTGLSVMYSPGPVAAGMKVDLQVQLFAMAAGEEEKKEEEKRGGGQVHLSHHILIHTETETLYLPVSAIILPGWQYDSLASDRTNRPHTGGARVRLLSTTPPVKRGVVLPLRPAPFTSSTATGEGCHH